MAASRLCPECEKPRTLKTFSARAHRCQFCAKRRRQRQAKAARLENLYGITIEEYDALLEAQGGVCAICGESRTYPLHVEHDHAVEREQGVRASIRGLVCKRDNKLLRDARDNAALLRACAAFLDNPPARGVLGGRTS